jgi:branched-chain amino acid transport system ATP-binding protein
MMTISSTPLLDLRSVSARYGAAQALYDVSLQIAPGEVVTLLGKNGMGKTTTIRAICRNMVSVTGDIRIAGEETSGLPSFEIMRRGIGLVPEGRRIFPNLNVVENLVATSANRRAVADPWTLERIFDLFPSLRRRARNMGNQLSGGEQQMLAIGRALMTNPTLLILDEATEGLAPLIRQEIWRCIRAISALGQSILIVDKNLDALMAVASRHYLLEKGRVVWSGSSRQLAEDRARVDRYLAV